MKTNIEHHSLRPKQTFSLSLFMLPLPPALPLVSECQCVC